MSKSQNPLGDFDYRVACDDFLIYELGRLVEEDRALLEDDEFRRVIDAGIHEHIERKLEIRASMAERLRSSGHAGDRTLRAIEDIETPLRDIPEIVYSYAGYLIQRLEQCSETAPDERVTTAADALLDSPDDRSVAELSIDVLASARSAVSARILAYVISEPLLEEDLEMKAYEQLKQMWPLPRHYILYSLKPHSHEDLPFRWFQLMIECNEPSGVDRILEEIIVHGSHPDYREDLIALVQLLDQARDPETEDKVLQVLNSEETPEDAGRILENYLKNTQAQRHKDRNGPWGGMDRVYASNRRYLAAVRLVDNGKKSEAARAIEELLEEDPQYPFALMLKGLLQGSGSS
jgi:hypothetical protein